MTLVFPVGVFLCLAEAQKLPRKMKKFQSGLKNSQDPNLIKHPTVTLKIYNPWRLHRRSDLAPTCQDANKWPLGGIPVVSSTRVLAVNPLSPVIWMLGPLWIRLAPACPIVLGSGEPSLPLLIAAHAVPEDFMVWQVWLVYISQITLTWIGHKVFH